MRIDVRDPCEPRWKERKFFFRNIRPLVFGPLTAILIMPFLLTVINGDPINQFYIYLNLSFIVGGFFELTIGIFILTLRWSWIEDRKYRLKYLKRSRRIREYIHIMNLEEVNWMVNEL